MISHGWKLGLCGLLLQGCADRSPGGASTTANPGDTGNSDGGSADTGVADSGDEAGAFSFVDGNDVDVLFVIDNSGSMAEEQALLAKNFAAFLDVLEGREANYRIGITTTDAGNPRCPSTTPENGTLVLSSCLDRIAAGEFKYGADDFSFVCTDFCAKSDADLDVRPTTTAYDDQPAPRRWIERTAGQSNIGGVASNVEAFQCYGPQGVAGCGFESHLESMYKALTKSSDPGSAANYGFLRESAILSIVVVSDETDCSYQQAQKDVFVGNKVYWNSPDDPQPTSALCWRAGVACSGNSPYSECHAENWGPNGVDGAADADAVLKPVSEYVAFVRSIEDVKKSIDVDRRVLVSLITGVPVGYDQRKAELVYEDAPPSDFPNFPNFQESFGIGPGCVLGPANDPYAFAVPPVREREFAEAFADPKAAERSLYSICQDDYSAALTSIAAGIGAQIGPTCMPYCVRDSQPDSAETVEPNCTMIEQRFDGNTDVPRCVEQNGMWTVPAGATVCFAMLTDKSAATQGVSDDMSMACADGGHNLEFKVVRTVPAVPGSKLSASCALSDNKVRDCPML